MPQLLLLLPPIPLMPIFPRHWLVDEELLLVDGCPRMCCWLELGPHILVDWCCCDLELLVDCLTSVVSSSLSEMVITAVGEGVS